jgi:bla regulator protein blaR1
MIWGAMIPAPLADHLWQSTLFGAAAALLAFALRKNRAQTRYVLWLTASLKFLVPFSLLVALGNQINVSWPAAAPIAQPAFSAAVEQVGRPLVSSPLSPSSSGESQAPVPASPVPRILLAIWLSGCVLVLLRWVRSWLRIRAAVRASVPLPIPSGVRILSSPSRLEPGVFGIFRPVLLLPAGITRHLGTAHLEAILAHELCHVRRRDNLCAALHMLVQTLFWFHPLVWWIGGRLVDERELACDEEVLQRGSQPQIYAESILKTCQFYLASPQVCVSGVTGADLKQRIVRIMSRRLGAQLNFRKKLLLATAAAAALAVPLALGLAQSQMPAASTPAGSFEVATVKPTKPGSMGMMLRIRPGGRFAANGITVKFLLQEAYNVKDQQIAGAPPWVESERFDIDAKAEDSEGAAMDKLPPEQRKDRLMQMMQSLLADRFKLALGHEKKEMAVYALVVAKGGPKLKPSTFDPSKFKPSDKPPDGPPPKPSGPPVPGKAGGPPRGGEGIWMQGPGQLNLMAAQLPMFVNVLSRLTGRIVIDKTGLTGRYDCSLHWTPDPSEGPMIPGGPKGGAGFGPGPGPGVQTPDGAPPQAPEASGPSLFTALQEQLGLKLEPQKAPVDILVIEHVEKPSEN